MPAAFLLFVLIITFYLCVSMWEVLQLAARRLSDCHMFEYCFVLNEPGGKGRDLGHTDRRARPGLGAGLAGAAGAAAEELLRALRGAAPPLGPSKFRRRLPPFWTLF